MEEKCYAFRSTTVAQSHRESRWIEVEAIEFQLFLRRINGIQRSEAEISRVYACLAQKAALFFILTILFWLLNETL